VSFFTEFSLRPKACNDQNFKVSISGIWFEKKTGKGTSTEEFQTQRCTERIQKK
jgi:hypothetical protein